MGHQYRIITAGAGWVDCSSRGKLRFEGRDAAPFLQALVSNDVLGLGPGAGMYATYLTPNGRMVTDLEVLHRGGVLLVIVPAGRGPELAARFDGLVFAEQLVIADQTADWAELAVIGRDAAGLIAAVMGVDERLVASLAELAQLDAGVGFILRTGEASLPVFHLVVPAGERAAAVERLEAAGVLPLSRDLATALRIEAGRPLWGPDLTTDTIPLEAGLLDRAISTAKGCYVGQEVVIRILHRGGGRVAKRLVQIAFSAGDQPVPASGSVVSADGREVGHVTSAAFSPAREGVVALAYVHRDAAEIGRVLAIDGRTAEITAFAR